MNIFSLFICMSRIFKKFGLKIDFWFEIKILSLNCKIYTKYYLAIDDLNLIVFLI